MEHFFFCSFTDTELIQGIKIIDTELKKHPLISCWWGFDWWLVVMVLSGVAQLSSFPRNSCQHSDIRRNLLMETFCPNVRLWRLETFRSQTYRSLFFFLPPPSPL